MNKTGNKARSRHTGYLMHGKWTKLDNKEQLKDSKSQNSIYEIVSDVLHHYAFIASCSIKKITSHNHAHLHLPEEQYQKKSGFP